MPHIVIKMYPGRTEQVKKELAEKTRDFFVEEMSMDPKYFSVEIEEVEKDKWQEKVIDNIIDKGLYIEANY